MDIHRLDGFFQHLWDSPTSWESETWDPLKCPDIPSISRRKQPLNHWTSPRQVSQPSRESTNVWSTSTEGLCQRCLPAESVRVSYRATTKPGWISGIFGDFGSTKRILEMILFFEGISTYDQIICIEIWERKTYWAQRVIIGLDAHHRCSHGDFWGFPIHKGVRICYHRGDWALTNLDILGIGTGAHDSDHAIFQFSNFETKTISAKKGSYSISFSLS